MRSREWAVSHVLAALLGVAIVLAGAGYALSRFGTHILTARGGVLTGIAAVLMVMAGWILLELGGSTLFAVVTYPFIAVYRYFVPERADRPVVPRPVTPRRLIAILAVGLMLVIVAILLT